ncbi:MAG: Rrf2 family transcriptional regulator [Melioribacteraceae bacterium]|nr:Rrf2 family transcriptional regulator [Melioribacteraceae bacterium]
MSASKKLSTSVKAICYLAESYPSPRNSKEIADSIGGNASKIRQLLSMLARNGIVKSTQGTKGGFILIKDPQLIHLQEVYCSVEDRKAFHLDVNHSHGESADRTTLFNDYFLDLFAEVQVDIEDKMRLISIARIMNSLRINNNYK